MIYFETRLRTLVKTIAWRIIATLITWGTIYFFSGNFSTSVQITLVAALLGMIVYYVYERAWNAINWGKQSNNNDQI